MSGEIKFIKLNILGHTYTIKTDADETYIKKLVNYIEKKKDEILGKKNESITMNGIIMIILNIVDEFFRFKEEIENKWQTIDKHADEIINKIEETLKKDFIEIKNL